MTGTGAVTVDESGRIVTWDLDGRPPLGGQVFSGGRVDLLQARPDGSILAAGPAGAWLLDGGTGQVRGSWSGGSGDVSGANADAVTAIASGPEAWAIGTSSGNVLVSPGSADDLVQVATAPGPVRALAVLADRAVAIADGAGAVTIVTPSGSKTSLPFDRPVLSLASTGRWLLAGANDGTIHVVDVSGPPREVAKAASHTKEVNSLEVAPDGATLASGSDDRTVVIWTIGPDGRLTDRRHLEGHTDRINTLSISPDGHWLASSGEDRQLILWNLDSGEAVGDPIPLLREPAVAFARVGDRQLFVSDDRDGLVRWEMRPEAWAKAACQLLGDRTFTPAERGRYLGGSTPPARCDAP
jgi:WD40 repeat protein